MTLPGINLRANLGEPWPDLEVTALSESTAEITPGCAFFAVAADAEQAQQHAQVARDKGAVLIVSQHALADSLHIPDLDRTRAC